MEELTVDNIIEMLNTGNVKITDIKDNIEKLSTNEIEEIALELTNDDDKVFLLPYVFRKIKIIKSLQDEKSIIKALRTLGRDEQKLKVIINQLKDDESRIAGIETLGSDEFKYLARTMLSREGAKEYFLEEERKYTKIGLDENMTVGIEIESEGLDSQEILEAGRNNGLILVKKMSGDQEIELEGGTILKRRRWKKLDNCRR